MKSEDRLREIYGSDPGFKVPEGYFESLQSRISDSLPPYQAPRPVVLSRWQRLKPYVYLAAMFCGIWLMMKVFHNVSDRATLNLDNPPQELIQLAETDNWDEPYLYISSEPGFVVEEEVIGDYENMDDFERDFGYEFKPEYANMVIPMS